MAERLIWPCHLIAIYLVCLLEAFSLVGRTCHVVRVTVADTVAGTVAGTVANIHMLTQDLSRRLISF